MGSFSGRWVAKTDVTVFSIGTVEMKAIFRNGTLEVTADEIDCSACQDLWKQREFGTKDWRVTCSSLIAATPTFLNKIISGGTIVVSIICGNAGTATFSFLGTGMITGSPLNVDNPMTQDITIVSAGGSPSVNGAT